MSLSIVVISRYRGVARRGVALSDGCYPPCWRAIALRLPTCIMALVTKSEYFMGL